MPNKNYVKGRAKEYRVAKKFKDDGWIVLRTAGSHGFADLIAIKGYHVKFIQCKPNNFSEKQASKLTDEWEIFNYGYNWTTSFEII